MSRMIFGIALCFALAVATGCGSKPTPAQPAEPGPEAKNESDAPPAPAPKVEAPKVVWELDADKHAIPAAPVSGRIAGVEVTPEVLVTAEEVIFRAPKTGAQAADRSVSLKLAPRTPGQPAPAPITGRNWKVKSDEPPGPNVPAIWLETPGQPILIPSAGYALTLELGPRKNGKVTGKVYLSLPAQDKTVLAGTFTTDYLRFQTEPPGPDEAPFVAGEVTVTGAPPDAKVRVACAAFLPSGGARFTESLATSSRYEHVRVEPGRYLVSAALVGGPAVWKWVDVPANGMVTENLALDATKVGSLEVAVPPDAKGKVLIAPADEPTRPPLDAPLFEGISVQVVRADVEVVAGKAVVKNLGAGRYEVRLGDERRIVDVVPGKTAEVNMTPAKK